MKKLYLLGLFFLCIISCDAPPHSDATDLCACYRRAHVYGDDTVQSKKFTDSCRKMHIDILNTLKVDPEDLNAFNAAFDECR